MFERFTDKARDVVKNAQKESTQLGTKYVGTEHLLLALLNSPGIAHDVLTSAGLTAEAVRRELEIHYRGDADALESIGIDLEAVRAKIEESFGPGALDPSPPQDKRGWFRRKRGHGHSPFNPRSKKVLELSLREALALKHNYIGTEHILLGLLREGQGLGAKVMADAGVDSHRLREQTIAALQVKP